MQKNYNIYSETDGARAIDLGRIEAERSAGKLNSNMTKLMNELDHRAVHLAEADNSASFRV